MTKRRPLDYFQFHADRICRESVMYRPELCERFHNLFASRIQKSARILDVGAYDGSWEKYLRRQGYGNVTSVDVRPQANFVQKMRIEDLQFPDESFDLVTSSNVIDPDIYGNVHYQFFFEEIARVLAPGGLYGAFESNRVRKFHSLSKVEAFFREKFQTIVDRDGYYYDGLHQKL